MKYLLIFFLLFSNYCMSQQTLKLCFDLNERYTVQHTGEYYDINVSPYTFYQVENDIVFINFKNIGTYVITATTYSGDCSAEDKFIVNVLECDSTVIWVPNSFTPNGDGNNDVFGAYGINISKFSMQVWNRWGELVFSSIELNNRWDGYYKQSLSQNDVYSYMILYTDKDGRYKQIFGRITLLN